MNHMRNPGTLEALLESAKLLHSSLDLNQLLQHLLRTVMGRLMVGRAVLVLDAEDGPRVVAGRGVGSLKPGARFNRAEAKSQGITHVVNIGEVGILGFGEPLTGKLSTDNEEFVNALVGLAATAIDNARAHQREKELAGDLNRRVQELRTLLDMVRGLTAALDPSEVARLLGLTVSGQWLLRRFIVVAGKVGYPPVVRAKAVQDIDPEGWLREAATIVGAMPVQALPDGELRRSLMSRKIVAVVPLRSGGSAIGLLGLGAKADGSDYSEYDLSFAEGLAAQAVVAFENAWFFLEAIDRKKLEQELELAAEIQEGLFPRELPVIDGFDVAAHTIPARHVGGDYYDAIPTGAAGSDRPYLLTVADVSGKGMAASLLMSNIQAMFRAMLNEETNLADLVSRSNHLIWSTTPSNKFVTAFLTIVDPQTGVCRYLSAGHNDSILLRADGSHEMLKSSCTPIGLLPISTSREAMITMNPGDLLVFFSDGVTEANDVNEEEFEEDRLLECLRSVNQRSAQEIVDAVFAAVDDFATGAPQYDDITLMVVKRTGR